jgi:hypothetical protein
MLPLVFDEESSMATEKNAITSTTVATALINSISATCQKIQNWNKRKTEDLKCELNKTQL